MADSRRRWRCILLCKLAAGIGKLKSFPRAKESCGVRWPRRMQDAARRCVEGVFASCRVPQGLHVVADVCDTFICIAFCNSAPSPPDLAIRRHFPVFYHLHRIRHCGLVVSLHNRSAFAPSSTRIKRYRRGPPQLAVNSARHCAAGATHVASAILPRHLGRGLFFLSCWVRSPLEFDAAFVYQSPEICLRYHGVLAFRYPSWFRFLQISQPNQLQADHLPLPPPPSATTTTCSPAATAALSASRRCSCSRSGFFRTRPWSASCTCALRQSPHRQPEKATKHCCALMPPLLLRRVAVC